MAGALYPGIIPCTRHPINVPGTILEAQTDRSVLRFRMYFGPRSDDSITFASTFRIKFDSWAKGPRLGTGQVVKNSLQFPFHLVYSGKTLFHGRAPLRNGSAEFQSQSAPDFRPADHVPQLEHEGVDAVGEDLVGLPDLIVQTDNLSADNICRYSSGLSASDTIFFYLHVCRITTYLHM